MAIVEFDQVWKLYVLRKQARTVKQSLAAGLSQLNRLLGYSVARITRKSSNRLTDSPNHRITELEKPKQIWALKDVSFQVEPGEAFGIIGPNGAGKSTTLKLLAGITEPTRGRINVAGRVSCLIELGAGFHPELTGRENIYMNASIMGLSKQEIDRRFDEIVSFAELEDFIDAPVKHYSSGMYARLGFAVAAHIDAELLLVDEVLAVGDASFQMKCIERISRLRGEGVSIVFVSHALETVESLCDRAMLLMEGQVKAIGDSYDVCREYEKLVYAEQAAEGKFGDREAEVAAGRREGTGEVEITGAELLKEDGTPASFLVPGEPVTVRLHYLAHRRVEEPTFTVTLRSPKGTVCMELGTHLSRTQIPAVEGRGAVDLHIEQLWLSRGEYMLSAQVAEKQGIFPYDRVKDLLPVRVYSRYKGSGLVAPPHLWSIDNGDKGEGTGDRGEGAGDKETRRQGDKGAEQCGEYGEYGKYGECVESRITHHPSRITSMEAMAAMVKGDPFEELENIQNQLQRIESKTDQLEPLKEQLHLIQKRLYDMAKDEEGFCCVCGKQAKFIYDSGVLPDVLRQAWGLSDRQAEAFCRRSSLFCSYCGSYLVLRRQAEVLLKICMERLGIKEVSSIAELVKEPRFLELTVGDINPIGAFHSFLRLHPNLHHAEYLPDGEREGEEGKQRYEDVLALTYPDNHFHLLLTNRLHHVPEPQQAFKEFFRVLKPGGFLIFFAPILPWRKQSVRRAVVVNGRVNHLQPPVYLGPNGEHLIYMDFGTDILDMLKAVGFEAQLYPESLEGILDLAIVICASKAAAEGGK